MEEGFKCLPYVDKAGSWFIGHFGFLKILGGFGEDL